MRFTKSHLFGTFAGLAWMGCNPSDFNSILDKAPVLDFGTPGSSSGALFVLPMPAPQDPSLKVSARMLVSRKDSNYLALASFDMDGKLSTHEFSDVERGGLGNPVYSSAMRNDGLIILGTPNYGGGQIPPGRVSTLTLGGKADGSAAQIQNGIPGDARMGISVAAGSITGAPEGDFVAVGDLSVELLGIDPTSPIASSSCPALQLGSTTGDLYAFRPLVVADLLAGGIDEIVLGGQMGGQGEVLIMQYGGTAASSQLPCPTKILTLGTSASFGTSLAAGDFDGDGLKDLAVGAPPNHVYVYFGPLDSHFDPLVASPPFDVDIVSATATSFGKNISTFGRPGQAVQLLVADPTAPSPGGVGKAMLFNIIRGTAGTPGTAQLVATLFDSNKDSDPGLFGLNLGGLQFNMGLCSPDLGVGLVPWASLGPNLLTFFAYSGVGAPADPRCFAH